MNKRPPIMRCFPTQAGMMRADRKEMFTRMLTTALALIALVLFVCLGIKLLSDLRAAKPQPVECSLATFSQLHEANADSYTLARVKERYVGRRVVGWEGFVYRISGEGDFYWIYPKKDHRGCSFYAWTSDPIDPTLGPGTAVTVTGTITEIDVLGVTIQDAEVEKL